ncbi:hypothetical protein GCM10025734_51220 [Kitasatospora paranensis]
MVNGKTPSMVTAEAGAAPRPAVTTDTSVGPDPALRVLPAGVAVVPPLFGLGLRVGAADRVRHPRGTHRAERRVSAAPGWGAQAETGGPVPSFWGPALPVFALRGPAHLGPPAR